MTAITGIKVFADTADLAEMSRLHSVVSGFTTNPTLMRRAGVADYPWWGPRVVDLYPDHTLSFEVLSVSHADMLREAAIISSWGPNVYVKIPVLNPQGESNAPTVQALLDDGIPVNVTAVTCLNQITDIVFHETPAIVSVFAGRIADTGVDVAPVICEIQARLIDQPVEVLWASTRQVYSVVEAVDLGVDIITVTPDLLDKLGKWWHASPHYVTVETVRQFYDDVKKAGYTL